MIFLAIVLFWVLYTLQAPTWVFVIWGLIILMSVLTNIRLSIIEKKLKE